MHWAVNINWTNWENCSYSIWSLWPGLRLLVMTSHKKTVQGLIVILILAMVLPNCTRSNKNFTVGTRYRITSRIDPSGHSPQSSVYSPHTVRSNLICILLTANAPGMSYIAEYSHLTGTGHTWAPTPSYHIQQAQSKHYTLYTIRR